MYMLEYMRNQTNKHIGKFFKLWFFLLYYMRETFNCMHRFHLVVSYFFKAHLKCLYIYL